MAEEPAAVLWDFDGTLIDSEPIWAEIQIEMLAGHGVVWGPEDLVPLIGVDAYGCAEIMAEAVGKPELAGPFFDEMEARVAERYLDGLPWLPGVEHLLQEVSAAGVHSAIVTASSGRIMTGVLSHFGPGVDFIITSDDVSRTKPDPEAYYLAMRRLGAEPRDVVVVEDSIPGTQAALATGAVVLAVPELVQLDPHPRMHLATEGLADISWQDLVGIWREHR